MNRILLSTMFLGGTLAVFGQQGRNRVAPLAKVAGAAVAEQHFTQPTPVQLGQRSVFWSEDFSGGMPAGWTTEDVGSAPGELVTFVWTNDPTAVELAALSWTESAVFNSTTASNGYLWANSDRGLSAAPANQQQTRLYTTSIDCSGQNSVLLTFQSTIGVFDVAAFTGALVRVSNDNGLSWTDYIPHPCLDIPSSGTYNPPCDRWSYNPDFVQLDITATAANQSNVLLRFEWNGGWEYYWAIDDMEMSSVPDYGRQMLTSYLSHRDISEGWEFGRVPQNQMNGTIYMGADVRNVGVNAQTNLTISGASTPAALSASANFPVVNYPDTVSMYEAVSASLAVGTYTVDYTLTSNEDANETDVTDDAIQRKMAVDNQRYALDGIGVYDSPNLSDMGTYSFSNNADGASFMTMYPIQNNVTVYGLEVLLVTGTEAGSYLIGSIIDTAQVLASPSPVNLVPMVESDAVDITPTQVTNGSVYLPFDPPYVLNGGQAYFASVKLFSNAGASDLGILDDLTVPQPFFGSMIHLATPTTGGQSGTFSNGNALAIRLALTNSIGIGEQGTLEGVNLYPNPTNGILNFTAEKVDNYTIEVMNAVGQTVLQTRTNGNTKLDLSGEASGVYMVRVSNGNSTSVQRVTLN
ncbi:MAG: T9SS type A sorting domain-containing protein [Flavobacteriales bacterium]|nr:T9SS type A sorting domain-containing protein [Flavobacteriales bacterium]